MNDDLRRVLAVYEQQLAERPDDARTLLKVGDLHLRNDAPAEAVTLYHRAAVAYAAAGQHFQAIAMGKHILQVIGERAPELAAKVSEVVLLLVASYLALGRGDQAIAVCEDGAETLDQLGLRAEAADLRRRAAELLTTTGER